MNVFTMQRDDGGFLVGIGLSEQGLDQLRQDHPILYQGHQINLPIDLFVYWAPDEGSFVEKLKEFGFSVPEGAPDGLLEGGGMTWQRKEEEDEGSP